MATDKNIEGMSEVINALEAIGVDFGETPGGQSDASTPAFQSGNTTLPRTPLSPMSPPDFLTVAEMREELRRRGVRGFSQMNRDQLIEALSGSQ